MKSNIDINKFQHDKQFCYLGSAIKENKCWTVENKRIIILDKHAFQKNKYVLTKIIVGNTVAQVGAIQKKRSSKCGFGGRSQGQAGSQI